MLRCIVARSPLATPFLPKLSFENEGYAFNREACERIAIIFGQFTRDLFAFANKTQCPAFFTRDTKTYSPKSELVAAIYGQLHPRCLVDAVAGKFETEPRALATMITLRRPKAPWSPRL